MDTILRPKNLIQFHVMKIEKSRTCTTPLESSHRAKSMVPWGHLGTFHGHYGLCWVQFWHEWAGRGCAYVFWSPGIVYCCSRKQMRWFITYQKPRALRGVTNLQQILTSDSSFEMKILCLLDDMFWCKKDRKLIHGHHLKTHIHQLGLHNEDRRRVKDLYNSSGVLT